MMNRKIRLLCIVSMIALVTTTALSQSDKCSAASIIGHYGFSLDGFHAGIGQYALVGSFFVDGKGMVKGGGTQSINGDQADVTFTGTYSVDADCAGVADLTFEDNLKGKVRFIVVSDGKEVLLMDVGGHTVETGYAKKQFTRSRLAK
jgi:hypothetical protein